jgi:hypothetical protein
MPALTGPNNPLDVPPLWSDTRPGESCAMFNLPQLAETPFNLRLQTPEILAFEEDDEDEDDDFFDDDDDDLAIGDDEDEDFLTEDDDEAFDDDEEAAEEDEPE